MGGSVLVGFREAGGATSVFSVCGLGEDASLREGGGQSPKTPWGYFVCLGCSRVLPVGNLQVLCVQSPGHVFGWGDAGLSGWACLTCLSQVWLVQLMGWRFLSVESGSHWGH